MYTLFRRFLRPKPPGSAPGRFTVPGRKNFGNDRSDHRRNGQSEATELLARGNCGSGRRSRFGAGSHERRRRTDNGQLYCSELVWESYLAPDGSRLFPARPMNFRAADGTMPQFWVDLFAKLGEEIPEGIPGTNPNDMAHDPQLKEIARYY